MSISTASWQARNLAPAVQLMNFRFTATANNSSPLPGVPSRMRIETGAANPENVPSVSGGTAFYLNLGNGTATVLTDGYIQITAGMRDVRLTAQINTLGTGPHDGTVFFSTTANNNPVANQVQGTFGQGSTNQPATVVIPAGTTVTYQTRLSASAENQVIQAGSFISIEEL